MASSPDDLIYVDKRLRTRRRLLTPREIETLRRRGIHLRRLGWSLTVPAGVLLAELVRMTVANGRHDAGMAAFFLSTVFLLGWARMALASYRLRKVRDGAEVIEHETASGAVESVLIPAELVIQHDQRHLSIPRRIEVRHIAYVPTAIVSAQQELLQSGAMRGERPLAAAEIRELERIRDSSIRPVHRVVGSLYTAAHLMFLTAILPYSETASLCMYFTVFTLAAGLFSLLNIPLGRRAKARRALLHGKVTVVSRELRGADVELLPGSNTPWTQNSQPARWRYD